MRNIYYLILQYRSLWLLKYLELTCHTALCAKQKEPTHRIRCFKLNESFSLKKKNCSFCLSFTFLKPSKNQPIQTCSINCLKQCLPWLRIFLHLLPISLITFITLLKSVAYIFHSHSLNSTQASLYTEFLFSDL